MLVVHSPVTGVTVDLSQVDDPVLARGIVGPGVAIDPVRVPQDALSPIAGPVVTSHPHAFAVATPQGQSVLVHLGIDTVTLDEAGFEPLVHEGTEVATGQPVLRWDPATVVAAGLSPLVPVVALDADSDVLSPAATGHVDSGAWLFQWS